MIATLHSGLDLPHGFYGFHARAALANHAEPIDATYSGLSYEGSVFSATQNRVQHISNTFGHVYQRASAMGN